MADPDRRRDPAILVEPIRGKRGEKARHQTPIAIERPSSDSSNDRRLTGIEQRAVAVPTEIVDAAPCIRKVQRGLEIEDTAYAVEPALHALCPVLHCGVVYHEARPSGEVAAAYDIASVAHTALVPPKQVTRVGCEIRVVIGTLVSAVGGVNRQLRGAVHDDDAVRHADDRVAHSDQSGGVRAVALVKAPHVQLIPR